MQPRLQRLFDPVRAALLSGPFRALKHRDFSRFAAGQTVSLIGTWMQQIAQGWLVLELTGSAFAVGLVTTLNTLPILLFTLYGGLVADRVDKRRFIIVLQSVMLLEASTLAALTLSGVVTVEMIWGLAAIHGLATAFEVPARQAFLVELVPYEDLVSAAALNSTIYNLARVVGPSVAGVLLVLLGSGVCFLINAISYLAVLISLFRIEYRAPGRTQTAKPSIFTGIRFIRGNRVLSSLTLQMMFISVFAVSFIPILPVFVREMLGGGASSYGALTSALGLGAATGAIIVGGVGRRVPRGRLASSGSIALAASVMLLSQLHSLPAALTCLGLAGAAMATNGISTATSLQLAAPAHLRGQVMSVYSFVVLGLAPIGAFQAGAIAERFGTDRAIFISGVVTMLGALALRSGLWSVQED